MRHTYCPHCGEKLILKPIGDEGPIPYCQTCRRPVWDAFTTSVICAVVNDDHREVALIRQDYVNKSALICVAGIMKPGESAEEAAAREIGEELGLTVRRLQYIQSYPFDQKDMLMLGFRAEVEKATFTLSQEVDAAQWVPFDKALSRIRPGSIAWRLVKASIEL